MITQVRFLAPDPEGPPPTILLVNTYSSSLSIYLIPKELIGPLSNNLVGQRILITGISMLPFTVNISPLAL